MACGSSRATTRAFRTQLTADIEQREKKRGLEDRQIRKLSTLADSMRASTEDRARKAKVLDRRVERMKGNRTELVKRERKTRFRLPTPARSGAIPLTVRGVQVSYGAKKVLLDIDFVVGRGDRVVVIGRNGAGQEQPVALPRRGPGTDPGHGGGRAQRLAGVLRPGARATRSDIAVRWNRSTTACCGRCRERRALLGSFGLTGGTAEQLPGVAVGR